MRTKLARSTRPGVRPRFALFASLVLVALGGAGCSIDERNVGVVTSEQLNENAASNDAGPSDARLLSSRSALDLGAAVTGFAALGRVTLTNDGQQPLPLSGASLTAANVADFQIVQNECGAALGAGQSCDVRIQFVPAQLGLRQNSLLVQPAQGAALRVPVQGRGLSPGSLVMVPAMGAAPDLGPVLLGEYAVVDLVVANPASTSSGVLIFDLASDEFQLQPPASGGCVAGQTQLAPGASCTLRLAFVPDQRGPIETTLSVTSANLGSSSLALSGTGMLPASLNLSPDRGEFPGVVLAGVGAETFALRNVGDVPVTLGTLELQDDPSSSFSIASSNCRDGAPLSGGEQCSFDLEFRPSQAGTSAASLRVAVVGGELRIPVRGEGRLAGALTLASEMANFGDVPFGERRVQRIRIENPDLKPSGPLTLLSNGDFSVLSPSQAGDCAPASTVLRGGEACIANVELAPSRRGLRHGTFSVVSELAGSASLRVEGRATLPGHIAPGREEVNFGDVARAASQSGQLVLSNDGDLPLAPLSLSFGPATSGASGSFTFDHGCDAALAPGASCTLGLGFQPSDRGVHSVTLALASGAEAIAPVLLRGVGVEPGNLTVQPSMTGGADFGDVAVSTSVQRQFSVRNPGGLASGLLSITSSNNRFVVSDISCAALGVAGLAGGRSCDFRVSFTPATSDALTANLLVSSSTAGRAGLTLSGRGRRPAALQGQSSLTYGIVGVDALAGAQRWTLTNTGDVATGVLTTTGVGTEFPISSDTCNGYTLQAGAQCSLAVGFRPQATGMRFAVIQVSAAGLQASLTVSGTGQLQPSLGEDCFAGICQSSSCETSANGLGQVCCAVDCVGTQRCSADFLRCEEAIVTPTVACQQAAGCPQGVGCGTSVPFQTNWDSTGLSDVFTGTCFSGPTPDFSLVFVAPSSGTYRFEATGSDSTLAVVNGACRDVTEQLACNDDFDATINRNSRLDVALTAGQTVTIYVSEFTQGNVGQGSVSVTLP